MWATAVDQLDATVDRLVELSTVAAADGELGGCLVRLQAIKARLCGVETKMLSAFDRRLEWQADGSKTPAAWLARRTRTPRTVLQGMVRLAKRLRGMPRTREALASGVIDQARAEALARLADSPRQLVRVAFRDDEPKLVGYARDLDEQDLATVLNYWRDAVDPDGGEEQAKKDFENRRVHLSQSMGGQWFLDGQLDPTGGEELAEALRRVEHELFKQDWDAAKQVHGDETRVEHLARTPVQRRADALVELARRAMAAPPGSRLPRPLVSVLVGYETLSGPVREMFNRTVLSAGQVARLLTDADVERVVFGPTSRDISDLGRRSRFFNSAQRRVIEIRDRECFHPSCHTSAEHCEIDHIDPWHNGRGPTNIDNGRPACRKNNNDRNKHPPPQPDG
jgi:hypothetical protein